METTADKVKRIIAEQIGVSLEEVKPDSTLVADLGADSLDLVETIMALEEEFHVTISDEQAEKAQTVAQVIELVEQATTPK